MKHKFFNVPAHRGAAEEELNQFTSAHQVVGVERQLVVDGANSFWALCMNLRRKEQEPGCAGSWAKLQRERSACAPPIWEVP